AHTAKSTDTAPQTLPAARSPAVPRRDHGIINLSSSEPFAPDPNVRCAASANSVCSTSLLLMSNDRASRRTVSSGKETRRWCRAGLVTVVAVGYRGAVPALAKFHRPRTRRAGRGQIGRAHV